MALSQQERTRKYLESKNIKKKLFALDADTVALFEKLAERTQQSQTAVLKKALEVYAQQVGLK